MEINRAQRGLRKKVPLKNIGKNNNLPIVGPSKPKDKAVVEGVAKMVDEIKASKELPEKKQGNIKVPDTNVLISDSKSLARFLSDEEDLVVIPETVVNELDEKKRYGEVMREARAALAEIDRIQSENNKRLIVEKGMLFNRLKLDKNKPDHQIIATLNYVAYSTTQENSIYYGYNEVRMISDDNAVKITARGLRQKVKIVVQPYLSNRVKIKDEDFSFKHLYVKASSIVHVDGEKRFLAEKALRQIPVGSAIIGYTNRHFREIGEFAAIRYGDYFKVLDEKISAYGIQTLKIAKNQPNWGQIIALHYLMDNSKKCVFLTGASGSGKSYLTIAAALELKERGLYEKIVIYRIPESAYGNSSPALPGTVGQKIAPWMEPVIQALSKIDKMRSREKNKVVDSAEEILTKSSKKKKKNGNGSTHGNGNGKGGGKGNENPNGNGNGSGDGNLKVFVHPLLDKYGIEVKVLDYIRGITLENAVTILDDAQNSDRQTMKNVISRISDSSLLILNGDLNQIDSKYISKESCGLAHATVKMRHLPFVAFAHLPTTVRGVLAAAAEKYL